MDKGQINAVHDLILKFVHRVCYKTISSAPPAASNLASVLKNFANGRPISVIHMLGKRRKIHRTDQKIGERKPLILTVSANRVFGNISVSGRRTSRPNANLFQLHLLKLLHHRRKVATHVNAWVII